MTETAGDQRITLEPSFTGGWHAPGHQTISILRCLPFFLSRSGKYVHRVRKARTHIRHEEFSHVGLTFWCGAIGCFPDKGTLFGRVPDGMVVCATCEGRAVGAGLLGEKQINGTPVGYDPRRQRK